VAWRVLFLYSGPQWIDQRGHVKQSFTVTLQHTFCKLLFATMAMHSSTSMTIFQFAAAPFEFKCCLLLLLLQFVLLLPLHIFLVVSIAAIVPRSVDFSAHDFEYLGFEIIGPMKCKA
jgi:hypothetical protein